MRVKAGKLMKVCKVDFGTPAPFPFLAVRIQRGEMILYSKNKKRILSKRIKNKSN